MNAHRKLPLIALTLAACWAQLELAAASQLPAKPIDYSNPDLKQLGLQWVTPTKDPKTGFVVGGKNSTDLIKQLTELNGRPIAELEADMRPGAKSGVGSDAGFLGKNESLLAVLEQDNRYVVEQLQRNHQQFARHLHILAAIGAKQKGEEFLYHGCRLKVTLTYSRGYQLSPFQDGTKTNVDVAVENLANGQKLEYSLLVAHMIERYGFYEGQGTPYRVEPARIVKVLPFLQQP